MVRLARAPRPPYALRYTVASPSDGGHRYPPHVRAADAGPAGVEGDVSARGQARLRACVAWVGPATTGGRIVHVSRPHRAHGAAPFSPACHHVITQPTRIPCGSLLLCAPVWLLACSPVLPTRKCRSGSGHNRKQ
jgi:hypothetical protein